MAVDQLGVPVRLYRQQSKIRDTLRWLKSLPTSISLPAGVLVVFVLLCFVGPTAFSLSSPDAGNLSTALVPPLSAGHLLGTDALGRDLLSRSLYGGQMSFEIGLGAVALGVIIGGAIGVLAGYFGGKSGALIMRGLDIFISFPPLVLALVIAAYLGPSESDVIIAIAFLTVPSFARLARAEVLKIRQLEYLTASELTGGSRLWRIVNHVLPNVAAPILSYAVLMVAIVMIIEAALDFLGLGVRPPTPTWGNMIADGQSYLSQSWWVIVIPALFLLVAVALLNLLGEAARRRWESR